MYFNVNTLYHRHILLIFGLQGETDTETFYDTDGDDRGYASFDETTIRKPHNEDPGYLSMDELKPSVPKTRRKRKPRNADGKQEVLYKNSDFHKAYLKLYPQKMFQIKFH